MGKHDHSLCRPLKNFTSPPKELLTSCAELGVPKSPLASSMILESSPKMSLLAMDVDDQILVEWNGRFGEHSHF